MDRCGRFGLVGSVVIVVAASLVLVGCSTQQSGVGVMPAAATSSNAIEALHDDLDLIFDDPKYANAFWGVRIEDLDGKVIYDRLGHKQFTPASNMKLYTTAAALDVLGPDYMYETTLWARGEISPGGVLNGDLVMTGSGDPSLGAWHPDKEKDSRVLLADWVAKIKAANIQEIRGNIIGDGRCFTKEFYCPLWPYGELNFWYSAGSSGLAMEENAFRCVIKPGAKVGDPAEITWTPNTTYIEIINETKTVEAGGKNTADSAYYDAEGNTIRFAGTIAMDKDAINERVSIWDGARYAAYLLKEELEKEGVVVRGEAVNIRDLANPDRVDEATASERTLLDTHVSPPMSEQCKVVNKPSHNFFADQMLRTMGMIEEKEGSFDAGVKVVRAWLERIGAPQPETMQMYDGSGLTQDDMVQPRQTCHLLRYMYNTPRLQKAFLESLPIAGVDGSLRKRMTGPQTKENVRAKTGYISNVRTLSGYVTNADGQTWVFSMMCNQYTVPTREVNKSQDKACEVLAAFTAKAVE